MLIAIWLSASLALFVSYKKDKTRTARSLAKSSQALKKLAPPLLIMIVIIGFTLAAVPQPTLSRLFAVKSVWGFVAVSMIGAVVTIPGPIAFPLAGSLLKMGAAPAALASFITTLTMVGLASSPMEAAYFGKRFTILRQGLSFAAAVIIGLLMGALL